MFRRIASVIINHHARSSSSTWLVKARSCTTASSSSSPVASTVNDVVQKNPWLRNIFRIGAFTVLTGAGIVGYTSYAYTMEELIDKTKWLQQPTPYAAQDDMPAYQKFQAKLYSVAKTATAKSIDHYLDLRKLVEEQIKEVAEPSVNLPPDLPAGAPTLVLDLDETLICTDWKRERGWRTFKRPGLDYFLQQLSQYYVIIIYTDRQDMELERHKEKFGFPMLGRSATLYQDGQHYRDLSKLNRDPSRTVYISGYALQNCLQPDNCIPIKAWNLEADDTTLLDLIPYLKFVAMHQTIDVRTSLASFKDCDDIPSEFAKRIEQQRKKSVWWRK